MIASKCKKCGVIGRCICNFGKYELTKEEKDKFDKALEEMNKQPIQFLSTWHTNKVIDFVNWYIELKGLGENNILENQSIVDSFLRGENTEVWRETINKPTIPEFKLSEKEKEIAEIYLTKIKKRYGTYGHITYSFTETGIGCCVKIKSSHKDKWKDITDLSQW